MHLTRDEDCSFFKSSGPTRSEAALQRLVLAKVLQDIKHNEP